MIKSGALSNELRGNVSEIPLYRRVFFQNYEFVKQWNCVKDVEHCSDRMERTYYIYKFVEINYSNNETEYSIFGNMSIQ
jgi:hypothetical protein